ncbi:hypothetical protein C1H46_026587 [Malus baccata]|uniref:Bromo domain-containing protein n=1 Tax=Malus baccata TaxID=106549 RepID=A0A540LNE9_MALBA|nr:hypothetical protein C1H46_026587 [Malus baccata]
MKIDRRVKVQCSTILKTLMNNKESWPFNEPVDPVKLRIPDYFHIISHPMDLDMVKAKLQKDLHFSAEEFAGDKKTAQNSKPKLSSKYLNTSTDSGYKQASGINAKQPSSLNCLKCDSCGNIACQCRHSSDSTLTSLSDKSSERSMGREHGLSNSKLSRLDCQAKSLSTSQTSKSDHESDGDVSALDGESICSSPRLTTPVSDSASREG